MKANADGPHGVLVVDKPRGPTSHDVVADARRRFGTRRVGHGGTLDPMATGVLILLFGEATKLCEVVAGSSKKYLAELSFGRATESHDSMGRVTDERPVPSGSLAESELSRALEAERRRALQVPPTVSALKVDGRRAHALTRAGAPPELAPRPVAVSCLELHSWSSATASVTLSVSKGYYVRALARDVGATLGIPTHLSALRRFESGCFTLAEACAWPPSSVPRLIALSEVLPRVMPTLRLNAAGVLRARKGQALSLDDFIDPPPALDAAPEPGPPALLAWTDAEGAPVALGHHVSNGYRVRRGFAAESTAPERVQPAFRPPPGVLPQTTDISKS